MTILGHSGPQRDQIRRRWAEKLGTLVGNPEDAQRRHILQKIRLRAAGSQSRSRVFITAKQVPHLPPRTTRFSIEPFALGRRQAPSRLPTLLETKRPSAVTIFHVPPHVGTRDALPVSTEEFRGRVERVADGLSYLSLVDSEGGRSFAPYDAQSLQELGIRDGSEFTCRITVHGSKAELIFKPLPRARLSDIEVNQLWERIDAALGEDDFSDDD